MDIYNLVSFSGIFVLMGFAWLLSRDKRNMNWRAIILRVTLQIIIALFIFTIPAGAKVNPIFGFEGEWSLKAILGYVFYPFTLVLGVPAKDAWTISRIIGERAVVTEVVAYKDLAGVLDKNLLEHPRPAVIAIYALCGFAHLASMAIFVGGLNALAPGRTGDIARVALRALVAATLACLMTACVAGIFFAKESVLLGG